MSKINEAVQKEIAAKQETIQKLKAKREVSINKLTAIQIDLVTKEQDLKLLVSEFNPIS